eukprot:jgi/Galph1/366/GphlegSOOS_G5017.1
MPTSRRKKHGIIKKQPKNKRLSNADIIQTVEKCLDEFQSIYVLNFDCIRSSVLKELRSNWKDSRFFFGKNKVIRVALGRTEEEEKQKELHKLADCLSGNVGVLFTNRSRKAVFEFFDNFCLTEYPRAGMAAPRSVSLAAGVLDLPTELEPRLRSLDVPATINNGEVELTNDIQVCAEGEILSPKTVKILKTLCMPVLEARVGIVGCWDRSTGFALGNAA